MQRENQRLYMDLLAISDIILTLLIFSATYYFQIFSKSQDNNILHQYLLLEILIIPVWFILIKIIRIQTNEPIKAYSLVLYEYALLVFWGICTLFIFIFIFKLNFISRLLIFTFGIFTLFTLFIIRVIYIRFAKKSAIKDKNIKNIILFADESSVNFIEKIRTEKHWGLNIFAIFTNSNDIKSSYQNNYRIINTEEDFDKMIIEEIIDEVIYCKNKINSEQIKNLIYSCNEVGITLQLQSDIFSTIAAKSNLNYLRNLPTITFETTTSDHLALFIKYCSDYLISLFALLFFSPFYLIIAILIKTESKGPVHFKQKRVGLHGRTFTMYKFRTMIENAEVIKKDLLDKNEADGPVFKIKDDPRITKIGLFLRKTSLDEFPQFINVLQGYMSVVGPRPPIPEEVELYKRYQLRRLSMKPGITCIWQTSGRNNFSFEKWISLDLQYIDNWSLKLDFILLLKTINTVFKRTGY